jgi:hypothetical protein
MFPAFQRVSGFDSPLFLIGLMACNTFWADFMAILPFFQSSTCLSHRHIVTVTVKYLDENSILNTA